VKIIRTPIFWSVVMVLLQWQLAPVLSARSIHPDLILVFVLFLGFHGDPLRAMFLGFCMGLAVDVLTWSPFGLNSLVYTLAGFVPHLFGARLFLSSLVTQMTFIIAFSFTADVIKSLYYLAAGHVVATGYFERTTVHLIWSIILFLVLFRVLRNWIFETAGS